MWHGSRQENFSDKFLGQNVHFCKQCNENVFGRARQRSPTNMYFFKGNDRNYRKRCGICLKLTIETLERRVTRFYFEIFEDFLS